MAENILIKSYCADGSTRQVHSDAFVEAYEAAVADVRRASHVEPVTAGPFRGRWFVDFLPLYEETGNPGHAVSLWPPYRSRAEALKAEVLWLIANYIRKS